MNESRIEWKVGMFVVAGVVLLALLILNFSKGVTLGHNTYKLRVILPNAAGLKPTADVMMAGLDIGNVSDMKLADNRKAVEVTVTILSTYKIPTNSSFFIDSPSFLGDPYVAVAAPAMTGLSETKEITYLQNGDTVTGLATFNLQEAERSITGLVDAAKQTMKDLDLAITNVNSSALSPKTLNHFVAAVSNLEVVSQRATVAADRVENLLSSNTAPFNSAVSNFQSMSARLDNTAAELDGIVVTNQGDVRRMVTNLTMASEHIRVITENLQAGKGPVGSLLKNEKMTAQMAAIVSNADAFTAEFSTFGSNLNQRGIWSMLWKPKPAHKADEPQPENGMRPQVMK